MLTMALRFLAEGAGRGTGGGGRGVGGWGGGERTGGGVLTAAGLHVSP